MKRKALVVVLGDLARSPRMQYHSISLARNNFHVTVIANGGGPTRDKAREELESNQNIKQNLMAECPNFKKFLPSLLAYIIKPIWQSLVLIYHLCIISLVNVIIIQNPPSIPTLPILCLYSKLTRTKLIIDWHNYGFSILGLNLPPSHPFVRLSKAIEVFFGRWADAGFCVSKAMRKDLIDNYNVKYPIKVLYDRPPEHFKPLSLREKHNFFLKMKQQIPELESLEDIEGTVIVNSSDAEHIIEQKETRFTITDAFNKNVIKMKPNRPAIIMSSTSWTEDEDFDLLLEALKRYDITMINKMVAEETSYGDGESQEYQLPQLVCVITGKGPLKDYYKVKIEECRFKHIDIVLPWLSANDYSKMVASCDLGISLHSSSSGVDLPMKIVDMFGCGIPVLAYKYPAIGELVVEDFYGLTFTDSGDLFAKLVLLLKNFYSEDSCSRNNVEDSSLGRFKKNIKRRFLLSRWEDNWNNEARPIFDRLATE